MQVPAEAGVIPQTQPVRIEVARFQGTDTDAGYRRLVQHPPQEAAQVGGIIAILAIAPEIDARDDDFGMPFRAERAHPAHHVVRMDAARTAARSRNDAISAMRVAAILRLHRGTRSNVRG